MLVRGEAGTWLVRDVRELGMRDFARAGGSARSVAGASM